MIGGQVSAIIWAQWRSILNNASGKRGGLISVTFVFAVVWYGLWAFAAFGVATLAADPDSVQFLDRVLPMALLLVSAYWQVVPIMMATSGLSLDLTRLLVYPIPHARLFGIEVILRISTSLEMVIIMIGLGVGLAGNPRIPVWVLIALVPFVCLNLLMSAGLRDLFMRLLARRGFREAAVLIIVLLAATPQLLLTRTPSEQWRAFLENGFGPYWPWSSTAQILLGRPAWWAFFVLAGWTALAYAFSRWQFERTLTTDSAEHRAAPHAARRTPYLLDLLLRLPQIVFRDPMAALVEKEIRSLSRAPRFRLLFIMGFSFGLLIWLPLAFGGNGDSAIRGNYLTIVSAYALMLLGEVCFWNSFGMDRTAAQTYLVMPIRFSAVIAAKNIAGAFFILVEISIVALFCVLLRLPVSGRDVAEAFSVTLVLATFLFAAGNMISTRYPRPINPSQSMRTGSMGRIQAFLLFLYPLASVPILLAYAARYAFEADSAFFVVLAIDLMLGAILYAVALESSVLAAGQRKELFVQTLSSGEGPVGT